MQILVPVMFGNRTGPNPPIILSMGRSVMLKSAVKLAGISASLKHGSSVVHVDESMVQHRGQPGVIGLG